MTEQHDLARQAGEEPEAAAGPEAGAGPGAGPEAGAAPIDPNAPGATPPGAPAGSNPEKDPSEWVTGDEPMTGPQRSYLQTLSREAGVPFDETLSKAQASQRIDELQGRTGRGGGGASRDEQGGNA